MNANIIDLDNSDDDFDISDTELKNIINKSECFENSRLRQNEQYKGFDNNTGDVWIYPKNLPCRSYQLSMTKAALYQNTLVVLPTGLGKTFIAAVVMYNIYRWYPCGKVIFMAPTRPLVNQQIEACQNIMPFPKQDVTELTGRLSKASRHQLWHTKRVFFVTPQVLQSDMDDTYPYTAVKLIVVDEAHRAKGHYAYVEVLQKLLQHTKYFRVVGLSATPGRSVDDVAEVCRNLLISHIEVRWDTSIDVLPYVHQRRIETVVVKLSEQIQNTRERLLNIIDPYIRQLIDAQVLCGSSSNLNRNTLLYEQKRFRDRYLRSNERHPQYSLINSTFSACISLYHALELLEHHGLRVFLNNFDENEEGKSKYVLQINYELRNLINELKDQMGTNPFDVNVSIMANGQMPEVPKNLDFGHPKFEKVRTYLKEHFMTSENSRAIIFCEFRESVMLIYRMLLQEKPLLRPRCFVGQGSNGGSLRSLTQKQQLQIMNDFKKGISNILIATSVGEEGIDVGEVELIICFDINTNNPTRFVQRIGRTGRKKSGHVIMLVSEGREQQLLKQVLANRDQVNKRLMRSMVVKNAMYPNSPRLVPIEYQPECVHMFVNPNESDDDESTLKTKKSKRGDVIKKKTSSKIKNSKESKINANQDLTKYFTKTVPIKTNVDNELCIVNADATKTVNMSHIKAQDHFFKQSPSVQNVFNDSKILKNSPACKQIINNNFEYEKNEETIKESYNRSVKYYDNNDFVNDIEQPSTSYNCQIRNAATVQPAITGEILKEKTDNTNAGHFRRVNKFLQTTSVNRSVLNRSKVNDLSYHIKSKEMSNNMKLALLKLYPEFIRDNLEKMSIIQLLNKEHQDTNIEDINGITPEEKSIRALNKIIIEIFGSKELLQDFLSDCELNELKKEIDLFDLNNEAATNCNSRCDVLEENYFKFVDELFNGYENLGPNVDNYDDIMAEFRKTDRYNDFCKQKQEQSEQNEQRDSIHDETSMIWQYGTNDGEYEIVLDSKYSDQWPSQYIQETILNQNTLLNDAEGLENVNKKRTEVTEKNENSMSLDNLINEDNIDNISLCKSLEKHLQNQSENINVTSLSDCSTHMTNETTCSHIDNFLSDNEKRDRQSCVDFDLAADDELFMNVFPEEEEYFQQQKTTPAPEHSHCDIPEKGVTKPIFEFDLFDDFSEEAVPKKQESEVGKQNETTLPLNEIQVQSPKNILKYQENCRIERTPKHKSINDETHTKSYKKSPSIFDLYLETTRGKGKLPKIASLLLSNQNNKKSETNTTTPMLDPTRSPVIKNTNKFQLTRRLIFESSDSSDENSRKRGEHSLDFFKKNEKVDKAKLEDLDTTDMDDVEEIPETQIVTAKKRLSKKRLRNRKFVNRFIDDEAIASDVGDSSLENEISETQCDEADAISLYNTDDEFDTDGQLSSTSIHAIYLKSIKSPKPNIGAFKIPGPRVYNDQSHIFSQTLTATQDTNSQYVMDSFVIDDTAALAEKSQQENDDEILSPLERAERILKERRKVKRKRLNFVQTEKGIELRRKRT